MILPHKFIFFKVLVIFLVLQSTESSNCNYILQPEYNISLQDFNVSRSTDKNYFCVAYYCSSPNEPMKAIVHSFNYSKKYDTLVYAGASSISFKNDCGSCPNDSSGNSNSEAEVDYCIPCKAVKESPNVEVHFRVNNPLSDVLDNKPCEVGSFFNMTIHRKLKIIKQSYESGCKKGFLVNIPQGDACDIISLEDSHEKCIEPTCSKDLIIKNSSSQHVEHNFFPSTSPGICFWKIVTKEKRYLELHFSSDIKDKLIIFEETLLRPKWNLARCSSIGNTLKLKLSLSSLYIMYKSDHILKNQPMFSIKFKKDFCPLPPIIDNAKEEFYRTDDGRVSIYSCNEDFQLVGPKKILCVDDVWQAPPKCVANENDLMSDDPENKNNASDIELDRGGADSSIVPPNTTLNEYDEGSGSLNVEYDADLDAEGNFSSENKERKLDLWENDFNGSLNSNKTYLPSWTRSNGNIIISVPNLEDNLVLFIIVGVGIAVIIIITIISVILCRKRRSNMNRTFDTQNPIYEKPIVRVPIVRSDSDPGQEKIDLGDLSDSTVLDM